jgi:hypothetical protein
LQDDEEKKTELPLAVDIAAVVGEAAPDFEDLDIEAEAERLAEEHPESQATPETIAEVIEDQIDAEKSTDED